MKNALTSFPAKVIILTAIVLLLAWCTRPACAQLIVIGKLGAPAKGYIIDAWGDTTHVQLRGKGTKKYKIAFLEDNSTYQICWQCADGTTHTVTAYTYLPHWARDKHYLYINACVRSYPDRSYAYYSIVDDGYVYRPDIAAHDMKAFLAYGIDPLNPVKP